mmetsp:Transcript_2816/g.5110  ORF Transcript_2816/g.5110 Transcript_2816/m.5110 type:complete len:412 (+) Transcript_2816:112-1347(+)|eukprot:CAMPEP_0201993414 /NCGR_PEP_ID=MMETSP0905-20130828/1652_1 /ASSEMBLY_ACC=CAM_ASM_000554 /TAXON_ID=420261 /ORGANISM="Thalassiosira antarctica, Strain CCMP982" /LENGTH=411 /DNA_ID=CAMNT_0048548257 /DNA_START=84 /DNA_END=1319 /DNA_ORIENTATION=-
MSSPLSQLSNDQWMDIIQYIGADDFKALRLAGNKAMCLSDPKLTSHLQLRMDRVPFFCENDIHFSEGVIRQWLENRNRLVINDVDAKLSPSRVAYLVANGFLDSVSEILVHDCHHHRMIIEILSNLPNVKSLMLVSNQGDQTEALDELEAIIIHVGNMHSLTSLDIEFDTVVYGSRLSFLRNLQGLKHLRLVGFDLSVGISSMEGLRDLATLHLCHGNFYSSPNDDANEKDLMDLIGLTNVQRLHLEGFDCLKGVGLSPFSATGTIRDIVMKHCQELSDECLASLGGMTNLNSPHFVLSSCDDIDVFDRESLQHLNTLSSLKSLSLFYVLGDPTDLRALPGLTALETLNIAFEETLSNDEVESLCTQVLQIFPSLQRLRIFSEDSMDYSFLYGGLDVDYATFNFGDLVYLD